MKTKQRRRCKVTGCVNKNKGCPLNVPLFKVPISNGPVLEKWVQETGDTDWLDVPIQYIKDNLRMCARHFLPTQLSVTAKQTRLKQPVAPTIFEDCVDRKPLTDQQIVAWRRAKHYGAHYDANLAKRKAQTEQLNCILKQVIPNLQDHGGEIGSESGVTTSTEVSAEEVGTGQNSSGTKQHQVPVQAVSADGDTLVLFPLVNASGGMTYTAYRCTPAGSEPGTSSQSGDGGSSNCLSFGDGMNRSVAPVSLILPEPPSTPKNISTPRPTNSNPADNDELAQPLPDTTPERKQTLMDTYNVVKKCRNPSASMSVSAKRFRPSVAKVRKTKRQMLQGMGAGCVEITPVKKGLLEELKKAQALIEQLQETTDHLKALKNCDNLEALLAQVKSYGLRAFIRGNVRNQLRAPTGRRWTLDEKLEALAIFKRSPKGYRYLCHLLCLPSVRTLQRLLQYLPMSPGINHDIIRHAAKRINVKDVKDKCVILMFDEVFIKKRLLFNPVTGLIEGFADYGIRKKKDGSKYHHREDVVSEHALVFMVQGLSRRYKQPVGFHFTGKTAGRVVLQDLIKEYISALEESGFHVLATVCDQGPTNRGAINDLMRGTDEGKGLQEGYFKVADRKVRPIYDVPHLFKNLRSNFRRARYIIWDNIRARFQDIVKAFELDRGIFRCKKLTLKQLLPKGRASMKVKWAAKTLSRTVAAYLKSLSSGDGKIRRLKTKGFSATAAVIKDFDKLFDAINGPSGPREVIYGRRENVSENSFHFRVWDEMIEKMEDLEFWSWNKDTERLELRRPPSQDGFIHTMKNMKHLWTTLNTQYGFKFLNLRQLNQDPLENLFSIIRQHGVTCDNPTVGHFVAALKTCIITNLTSYKSRGSNADEDDGVLMSNLRELLEGSDVDTQLEQDVDDALDLDVVNCLLGENDPDVPSRNILREYFSEEDFANNLTAEELEQEMSDWGTVAMLGKAHVAGYLGRKITAKVDCEDCHNCLLAVERTNVHAFTMEKEYNPDKPGQFYASIHFCNLVQQVEEEVDSYIVKGNRLYLPGPQNKIRSIILLKDLSWIACQLPAHYEKLTRLISDNLSSMLLHTVCKRICEDIILQEEVQKRAREAEKVVSQEEKERRLAVAAAKKAAKERKKAAAEIRKRLRAEKKMQKAEALRIRAEKREEAIALRAMVNLEKQGTPSRPPSRVETILARANSVWNVSNVTS